MDRKRVSLLLKVDSELLTGYWPLDNQSAIGNVFLIIYAFMRMEFPQMLETLGINGELLRLTFPSLTKIS